MRLTRNFHDWETVASRDHPTLAYTFEGLPPHLVANAMRVLLEFGQPSRDLAGEHEVLSFIRSPALSKAIPGAKLGGDHEAGLAMDFSLAAIGPDAYLEMATEGHLQKKARWDKLNLYTATGTWHVGLRPIEAGAGRRRIFIDWQEVA